MILKSNHKKQFLSGIKGNKNQLSSIGHPVLCEVKYPKYYKHSNESDTFPFLGRFGRQESTENFYKVSIFGSFPFKFLWTKQIQE